MNAQEGLDCPKKVNSGVSGMSRFVEKVKHEEKKLASFKDCLDESRILCLLIFILMLFHQRFHQTCQTLRICFRLYLVFFFCQTATELCDELHLLRLEEFLLVLCF
jgi:hypothetical protein